MMARFSRVLVLGGVLVGLAFGLAGVSPAYGNSPWWHVSVASRPTYLRAGQARNEMQRLTVVASEGSYALERPGVGLVLFVAGEEPERVQRALEEELYGEGNVRVTGGPGPGLNNPSEVYEIEFVGNLAGQPVQAPLIGFQKLKRSVGGKEEPGSVTLSELSSGRPDGQVMVTAVNLGDANADPAAGPITITDKLPSGLRAVAIEAFADERLGQSFGYPLECSLGSLSCTFTGKSNGGATSVPPYEQIQMRISVVVAGAESGEIDEATVTGGGAPGVKAERGITVSDAPVPFGVSTYEMRPEEDGGGVDTQAGSHPFQLTTTLAFNETFDGKSIEGRLQGGKPVALTKDLHFKLPPGLIGNPTPFAQCTLGDFLTRVQGGKGRENTCSAQTVVGVARVMVNVPRVGSVPFAVPLFNLVPSVGEPARFGFLVYGIPVLLTTAVRTGGDYGVTVNVTNISQEAELSGSEVTFWGVPGDGRHDMSRNGECLLNATLHATEQGVVNTACPPFEALRPPPLLALPTSCTGPLRTSMEGDSWIEPGNVFSLGSTEPLPAVDGCNRLQFNPSISVAPDGQAGSTPTGLAVSVHVPQDVSLNPNGLAEADVKDTTVALPEGVAINPAGADGLQACSEAQIALDSAGVSSCPSASKVGLVRIKTPLLPNELEGAAYLAAQNANPFGSLVALYVFAEDPVSGSRVKLAGEVVPDPVTGQLVSTFKNTPQLPFETFELHFFGGDRAPLSTPGLCGAYTTMASIAPWTGTDPVGSSSTFDVVSGPNGGPCADPLPFRPSLTAGMTSIQAGGFSPFTMTMSRPDGSQNLQAVTLKMPPGLLGTLSGVKLCAEPQADLGTCGPASLIGHTTVSVGVGGDPYTVTGGEVFITGPYEGAPYGLSIVNPAKAGPYDLGRVIVRAKIEVDPITAALTVSTDTSGPFKIPTILDGIPLQIQHVNVSIDRPGFTFNPTNCSPLKVGGSLQSSEGSTAAVSVPFQITNCAVLAFKPKLTASTNGNTSRANGASLKVRLTYPAGPYDANIARVKVDLPKQLPSRLTTLQHACPVQMFEANPAACPAASIVGHATATTPVLPVPLYGPAYFVSHAGEEFPELIIVLQGYGTTVHLIGSTFINKAGVTSSTFKTIPDVPVGTFELSLPQGKFSALAANTNLCTVKKLAMPTSFIAQNGASVNTPTPIVPTGCHRHKGKKSKKASRHIKGGKHK
jgi:hypothetical protein